MPIYDYKCESCDKVIERLVNRSECDNQRCDCEQKSILTRQITNSVGLSFKGKWFSNSKEY